MKVLVTGALKLQGEGLRLLNAAGLEVTYHPDESVRVKNPELYEAVVCNGLFLHQPLSEFISLRMIQLTSAGCDRVPAEEIAARRIMLFPAKGVYSKPLAESVVCGLLQLYRQTRYFDKNQQSHRWEKHRGLMELCGKTACIVGAGSIGTEIAKRLRSFDMQVFGLDVQPRKDDCYTCMYPLSDMDDILHVSHAVILSLPLTSDTKGMFGKAHFDKMRDNAVFVNIARGSLVDEAALAAALSSGKLLGAVLDVFEQEPLPGTSPLWDMENVIITPHNAFVSDEADKRLFQLVYTNLLKETDEIYA